MVGFFLEPSNKEDDQDLKFKNSNDTLDTYFFEAENFHSSCADSFVDFDCIKDWIEEFPNPDKVDPGKTEFELVQKGVEMPDNKKSALEAPVEDPVVDGPGFVVKVEDGSCSESTFGSSILSGSGCEVKVEEGLWSESVVKGVDADESSYVLKLEDGVCGEEGKIVSGSNCVAKVEAGSCTEGCIEGLNVGGCEQSLGLSCSIEEEMGRVSLAGAVDSLVIGNGNGLKKGEMLEGHDASDSGSETESASSSSFACSESSSSSSDDCEEEEEGHGKRKMGGDMDMAGEVEEGEIRDIVVEEMVGWSDNDDGNDDGNGNVIRGPVKSKNELEVLPPVPPVNVTLQSYHHALPVGVVLSIIGAQVIVAGVEKHNPLNEGSILWITGRRCPLGLVDEIFGPVKNPFYIVRYNSENEIPAGISEGTSISFVPEFANHVLNDKSLYKKGYDASGENDEELSDEVEFSDDEKEAEYKRMLKMTKRGPKDKKLGNKENCRKVRNRSGTQKHGQFSAMPAPMGVDQPSLDQNQHDTPPLVASLGLSNCSGSIGVGQTSQTFTSGQGLVPSFPQLSQAPGFIAESNVVWTNRLPYQQQQNAMFPNGLPAYGMPAWPQQIPYLSHQMPLPNGIPFQQQFNHNQESIPNVFLQYGQPNIFLGTTRAPCPGLVGQGGLNQTSFETGLQGQNTLLPVNGVQGHLSTEQHMLWSSDLQPPANIRAPLQFNMGASSSGHGKKPYHRGGGCFGGGRGQRQSK